MRFVALLLLFCLKVFAISPTVSEMSWENGVSFLRFLEKNKIPLSLFYSLSAEDKESVADITAGTKYDILRADDGSAEQILIPITDELQAHIYRSQNNEYKIDFIPIIYETKDQILNLKLDRTVSQDIYDYTGSGQLAAAFNRAFRGQGVDFKKVNKGDRIIISYSQKFRLGRAFGTPTINYAMLKTKSKTYTAYYFNDKFYDRDGKEQERFFLIRPLGNAPITSPFSLKRYHPVLKRYRAHLGVDYGAPRGTPIKAAGDGTIKFVGTKNGYGKTVIIRHAGDYESLYAHLNNFAKGIKAGQSVKQGKIIGYVGSSGIATGPHLHLGLYLNKKPINPESVLKVVKSKLDKSRSDKFKAIVAKSDRALNETLQSAPLSAKLLNTPEIIEYHQ